IGLGSKIYEIEFLSPWLETGANREYKILENGGGKWRGLYLRGGWGLFLGFGGRAHGQGGGWHGGGGLFVKRRGPPQALAGVGDVICQKLYPLGRVELPKD